MENQMSKSEIRNKVSERLLLDREVGEKVTCHRDGRFSVRVSVDTSGWFFSRRRPTVVAGYVEKVQQVVPGVSLDEEKVGRGFVTMVFNWVHQPDMDEDENEDDGYNWDDANSWYLDELAEEQAMIEAMMAEDFAKSQPVGVLLDANGDPVVPEKTYLHVLNLDTVEIQSMEETVVRVLMTTRDGSRISGIAGVSYLSNCKPLS
jgi:hypothetical protein